MRFDFARSGRLPNLRASGRQEATSVLRRLYVAIPIKLDTPNGALGGWRTGVGREGAMRRDYQQQCFETMANFETRRKRSCEADESKCVDGEIRWGRAIQQPVQATISKPRDVPCPQIPFGRFARRSRKTGNASSPRRRKKPRQTSFRIHRHVDAGETFTEGNIARFFFKRHQIILHVLISNFLRGSEPLSPPPTTLPHHPSSHRARSRPPRGGRTRRDDNGHEPSA